MGEELDAATRTGKRARASRSRRERGGVSEDQIAAMAMQAMSLEMPVVDGHPNRMPFTGILTRLDVSSDSPPHGTNGKRIILTTAAAEQALPSLLGMGVDLTKDMDGHDATKKVGIITGAHIAGNAIHIEGFIYAADFPREALRIQLDKADLGFSFEARNLAVESMATDPVVIKRCVFTGAAILLKNEAAYQTTALAAARAKEHEMDEIKDTVAAAVAAALAPLTTAISAITAAQAAQGERIEALAANPGLKAIEANAALCARLEPHCARLEAAAADMEKDGVGLAAPNGQIHLLRRMASAMRVDAAGGRLPLEYHDGGYSAARSNEQTQQQTAGDDDVKVQDDPEFLKLKASFDKQAEDMKKVQDQLAAMATQNADMQAKVMAASAEPERKTVTPAMARLLSRHGLEPDETSHTISLAKIDAALAKTPDMTPDRRLAFKLQLQRDGILASD